MGVGESAKMGRSVFLWPCDVYDAPLLPLSSIDFRQTLLEHLFRWHLGSRDTWYCIVAPSWQQSLLDVALLFACCLIHCKHLRLSDVNKHTYLLTYLLMVSHSRKVYIKGSNFPKNRLFYGTKSYPIVRRLRVTGNVLRRYRLSPSPGGHPTDVPYLGDFCWGIYRSPAVHVRSYRKATRLRRWG